MATDFASIHGDAQKYLNDTSSTTLTLIKKFVNRTYRDAWDRHQWTERFKGPAFIAMTAPYVSTSSITVTVTNGSATVTGSGTTFPSYSANTVKFALSVSGEWYGVSSRDSATQLTLDRNYLGDTASAQAFIVYQDVYNLASDVGVLLTNTVAVHKNGYGGSLPISRARAENEWAMPTGTGTPTAFIVHDRVSGLYRIRVGPEVPSDDNFAIRYSYFKDITELSGDTDEPLFHEDKREMLLWGTLARGYLLHGRAGDARDAAAIYEGMLKKAWDREQAAHPKVSGIRTVGGVGYGYPIVQYPVVAP